jgi:hypothetical protein
VSKKILKIADIENNHNDTISLSTASQHLRPTPGSRQAYLEKQREKQREEVTIVQSEIIVLDAKKLKQLPLPRRISFYIWTLGIRHGDCIRDYRKVKSGTPFLVLGLFNRSSQVPHECQFSIRSTVWLFWQMWWNIVLLRGFGYLFSLKDVQGFKIYNASVFASM